MGDPGVIDGTEHQETDNFLSCQFVIDGIIYSSFENYFQCAKTTNEQDREKILNSGPGDSYALAGQTIQLRSDWESVKMDEMYKGNLTKFQQDEDLTKFLLESGTEPVDFTESSPFWNHWNDLIMQRIRAELRQNGEEDASRAAEIREAMEKYTQENK
ncbi:unnamed protein product [Rotaria sp. Silwood2]|nr:unnamed protein product [Rotaria sp. Silwood2]CAF2821325.1 unnamed protein product [Rotaria sp. Silwood2]CAF3083204.1 unnamed protein product [Rotaria sp. Silwood2]CAF3238023.1 unnamed protein product [Rotaria sp. Silwood2]CAF3919058.1 unnamed protein product [Rotaria sp. Silwood2]